MIDFLVKESWINPQIDFLVFLQNIRIQHFEMFNGLFLSITVLGEFWLPAVICSVIYWCIDSLSGLYLLSLMGINLFFSHLSKTTAAVYRPWILSDKVKPVELALPFAKSYSFPSGHSLMASSVFGGLAYILRKKRIWCVALILLVLLVGFSRMWVGVHTPQDVIVGISIGFILVFVMNFLIKWAEKNKNRYLYLLAVINICALLEIIYVTYFLTFPLDYVNGTLLVNPNSAIRSNIVCVGFFVGVMNGGFLCRRFFPFDAKSGSKLSKIIRGIAGSIIAVILFKGLVEYSFFSPNCNYKMAFILPVFVGLFISAIYPFIFSKLIKKNTVK